jgi:hypothetical protein
MLDLEDKQMFEDFLATLRKDSKDQYMGHLFQYIQRVIKAVLSLGKERYSPVLSLTLFARDSGDGGIELTFRPEIIGSPEMHQKLKLGVLNGELKTAVNNYGRDVWGFSVFDERNDMRETMKIGKEAIVSWGHLMKEDKGNG